jgi:6-pyruvoyltetrahydropterin/6-carboxytetrahydropterin synthase
MFEVSVDETFSAGHALRGYHGKCENVHGHNYRVRVIISGEQLDSIGLLVDFVVVKQALRGVIATLDHRFLNDFAPFDKVNPSAENIARHIHDEVARQIQPQLDNAPGGPSLTSVTVWETDTTFATYRP